MHSIHSDNKICILRRTADGHTPDRRLAVEVSNGGVRRRRHFIRNPRDKNFLFALRTHCATHSTCGCTSQLRTPPSQRVLVESRAAAELLAAWTCVAQTRTQEGAEGAKERRRKIQGCAGTQSICAPAGARVLDDAYISQRRRCRAEQVAKNKTLPPT